MEGKSKSYRKHHRTKRNGNR